MTRKYDNEGRTLRVRLGYAEKEVESLRVALAAATQRAEEAERRAERAEDALQGVREFCAAPVMPFPGAYTDPGFLTHREHMILDRVAALAGPGEAKGTKP